MSGKRASVAVAVFVAMVAGSCNSTFFDTFDVESGKSRVLLADQRVLITKTIVDDKGATVRIVCAEPSPDAITVFGASIAASGVFAGSEQVGISGGYQEAAAAIGLRTASITLIRDIAYRACEARMNGAFGEKDYQKILAGMPAVVLGVFAIDGLTQMRGAPAVVVNAGTPRTTAEAGHKPAAGEKAATSDKRTAGVTATAGGEPGQAPSTSVQDVKTLDTQYISEVSKQVLETIRLILIYLEYDPKRLQYLQKN